MDIYHDNALVEVKYREKPEIKGALKTAELLKAKKLVVITKDFEEKRVVDNLEGEYVSLWRWLFSPKENTSTIHASDSAFAIDFLKD